MPKIVDKSVKREMILMASIRIFAKKGLARSTVSDIAAAAGIGKGTVYEYFESKGHIFVESFRFFMNKFETELESRLEIIRDPLDRLAAYIRGWEKAFSGESLEYLEIFLEFWAENMRRKEGDHTFDLADMYTSYRTKLGGMLEECVAKGRIRRIDINVTSALIIGALDGLMIQWIMDRQAFDMGQALDTMIEVMIDGLKENE